MNERKNGGLARQDTMRTLSEVALKLAAFEAIVLDHLTQAEKGDVQLVRDLLDNALINEGRLLLGTTKHVDHVLHRHLPVLSF